MPIKKAHPATTDFGERLDDALAKRGMSQNELARATHTPPGQISKIRSRGALRIGPSLLFAMADALHVEARWLFLGDGPRSAGSPTNAGDEGELRRLRERVARLEESMQQIETAARGALRRASR